MLPNRIYTITIKIKKKEQEQRNKNERLFLVFENETHFNIN